MATQAFFSTKKQLKPPEHSRKVDLSGSCTLDHSRSYVAMVKYFESIFAKDTVAIIPSAFVLIQSNSQTDAFRSNVLDYPLSSNVAKLIKILRGHLSVNYIGAHLRYRDDAENSEYDESIYSNARRIKREC